MVKERRDEALFGQPDGAMASFDSFSEDFVRFPPSFGGIGRDPSDARVRVIVGPLGTGKSLHLRRMQNATSHANESVYSDEVRLNTDLVSEDLAAFAARLQTHGSSEFWKILWRRAIFRSAASHIQTQTILSEAYPENSKHALKRYESLLGTYSYPRSAVQVVKEVILQYATPTSLRDYLTSSAWSDVESALAEGLRGSRPIFLYLDHFDDSFRWAPSLWSDCQKGLFYTVMDMLREDIFRNKLHITITIRDITYAAIRASEHAPRYLDRTHINLMAWNRKSISFLLHEKLKRLPAEYFSDPDDRSVASWVGMTHVTNNRPNHGRERPEEYLLRHTRLAPRDLIAIGNAVCDALRVNGGHENFDQDIYKEIVSNCARDSANSQIAQTANHILSDGLPRDAVAKDYDHVFLRPNDYAEKDASAKVLECIDETGSETVGEDKLKKMNQAASDLFGWPINLADICWQNGLLGVLTTKPKGGSSARFFSIDGQQAAGRRLPLSPTGQWIWHPILFDVAPRLEPVLERALWVTE